MPTKPVSEELAELAELLVAMLDDEEERANHEATHYAVSVEDGHARRDGELFAFTWFPDAEDERWTFELDEDGVRDLADRTFTTVEVTVTPVRKAATGHQRTAGQRMLDALVAAGLVELRPRAKQEAIATVLERAVWDALDDGAIGDEERGVQIQEALVDLSGVEDVFGEGARVVEVVRSTLE